MDKKCIKCLEVKRHYARGWCRACYRSETKEGYKRYQKDKDKPEFRKYRKEQDKKYRDKYMKGDKGTVKRREAHLRWTSNPENKKKKAIYDARWRKEINPEASRAIHKRKNDKRYFDGKRYKALKRDGYKCRNCPITQEESLAKWGSELTVHHIDGLGRPIEQRYKNNKLLNFLTLCKKCHGKLEMGSLKLEDIA